MSSIVFFLWIVLGVFSAAMLVLLVVLVRLGRSVSRTMDNSQKIQQTYQEVSSAVSIVSSVVAVGSLVKKLSGKGKRRAKK